MIRQERRKNYQLNDIVILIVFYKLRVKPRYKVGGFQRRRSRVKRSTKQDNKNELIMECTFQEKIRKRTTNLMNMD